MSLKPRAYRLDQPQNPSIHIEEEEFGVFDSEVALPAPKAKSFPWFEILFSCLAGLLVLSVSLWTEQLVIEAFQSGLWLGWLALGVASLAALAFLFIVGREVFALLREQQLEHLHKNALQIIDERDSEGAKRLVEKLASFYHKRPETAKSRNNLLNIHDEILEAEDRLAFAERGLLQPLDIQAKKLIAASAQRVSLITAVAPRAFLDVVFVVYTCSRLLRLLAQLYGGRPGFFGFLKLGKAALAHLAVTGSLAVGDNIIQGIVGHGLAGRLSARLGEGVINGMMTARFGLAALHVCRPLPFIHEPQPSLKDVAESLLAKSQ